MKTYSLFHRGEHLLTFSATDAESFKAEALSRLWGIDESEVDVRVAA